MVGLASRSEGTGDGDEDDLLVLELCSIVRSQLRFRGPEFVTLTLAGIVLGGQTARGDVLAVGGGGNVGELHTLGEAIARLESRHVD